MIKVAPNVGVKTYLHINKDSWTIIFKSLEKVCRETRVTEFQFKLINRIVITRKELFIFGIKTDDECLYCGDKDSLSTLLLNVHLRGPLEKKVIQWCNEANCCQISPATEELLFGIIPSSKETKLTNKFNLTLPYLCAITYIQTKSIVRAFTCTNSSISYLLSTI